MILVIVGGRTTRVPASKEGTFGRAYNAVVARRLANELPMSKAEVRLITDNDEVVRAALEEAGVL